ncbi:MAG: hypothetical protein ACFCVH_18830 [Alphaproteobacteria bacterium]
MVQRRRGRHAGEATAVIIPHMMRCSPDPDALERLVGLYRTATRRHLDEIGRLLILNTADQTSPWSSIDDAS